MSNIQFKLNYITKDNILKNNSSFSKTNQTINTLKTEINSTYLFSTIYTHNSKETKNSLKTLKYNSWFLERNLIIYKKLLKTTSLNYFLNFPYQITETVRLRYKYQLLRKKIFFLYLSNKYISLLSTLLVNKHYNKELLQSFKMFYNFLQKKNSNSKILKLFFFKFKQILTSKKNIKLNKLLTYKKKTQTIQVFTKQNKININQNSNFFFNLKKILKKKIISTIFKYSIQQTLKKIILTYIQSYTTKIENKTNINKKLTHNEIKILISKLIKPLLENKKNSIFFNKTLYSKKYNKYLTQVSHFLINNIKTPKKINNINLFELKYNILFHKKIQTSKTQLNIINPHLYKVLTIAQPTKLNINKRFNFLKLKLWRLGRISNFKQLKKTLPKNQKNKFKIPYSFISLNKISFESIQKEIESIPQIYFFEHSLLTNKTFLPLFLNILLTIWKINPLTFKSIILLIHRYNIIKKLLQLYSQKQLNDKNSTN